MELFGFGPHLMIDGYHADPDKLDDLELARSVLNALPKELQLSRVLEPHVVRMDQSRPDAAGITGVVILAESHIAIHTFPLKRFLSLDVFSAKEFDSARAVQYLVNAFGVGRFETHQINRGKEFPRNLSLVEKIIVGERDYLEARIG